MSFSARKENLTGFSTGLTGRSKNLDPTGFHLWCVSSSVDILDKFSRNLELCVSPTFANENRLTHAHSFIIVIKSIVGLLSCIVQYLLITA